MTAFATLYLPTTGDDINESRIEKLSGRLTAITSDNADLSLLYSGHVLQINRLPPDKLSEQIIGLSRYVMSINVKSPKPALAVKTLETIAKIKSVFGCVVEPDFDEDGVIRELLMRIIEEKEGLMFAQDTIFDSVGRAIFGPLSQGTNESD